MVATNRPGSRDTGFPNIEAEDQCGEHQMAGKGGGSHRAQPIATDQRHDRKGKREHQRRSRIEGSRPTGRRRPHR